MQRRLSRETYFGKQSFYRGIAKLFFVLAARNEPQATAVELAQLGEVDSPQYGEMSRKDKGAEHPLNRGQLPPA